MQTTREKLRTLNSMTKMIIFYRDKKPNQELGKLLDKLKEYKLHAADLISLRYLSDLDDIFVSRYTDLVIEYIKKSNNYRLLKDLTSLEGSQAHWIREGSNYASRIEYENEYTLSMINDLLEFIGNHNYNIRFYNRDLQSFIDSYSYINEPYFTHMFLSRMLAELEQIASQVNIQEESSNEMENDSTKEIADQEDKKEEEVNCCSWLFSLFRTNNRIAPENTNQEETYQNVQRDETANNTVTPFATLENPIGNDNTPLGTQHFEAMY